MANAQRIQRALESAVGQFQAGDLDGAAERCTELLKKQPKNHHALHILGAVRLRQNDPETALKLLKSASKRDPHNGEILANLGTAYRMSGDASRAVAMLRKAVKLGPGNVSTLLKLGNAAVDAGNSEAAIKAYREVISVQPDHVDALNRLGVLLAEAGDHHQAIDLLREAAELAPDDPDIRINFANVLALNFEIDRAVSLYQDALADRPNDPEILCNLGNTLSRGGRRQDAADQYRAVIASNPEHSDAHASLANNLLANGEFAEGWQHYLHRPSTRSLAGQLHRIPLPRDLSGKSVGVIADQGLGDQVFFARFLPELKARGAETIYRPEARLTETLRRAGIATETAPANTELKTDFVVSAGDLPFLLQDDGSDKPLPYAIPALADRTEKLRDVLSSFGPAPWTGVTWRAGTANMRLALSKEIPVTDLATAVSGCSGSLIVVQRNCSPDELAEFQRIVGRSVLDLSHCNDDVEDLLALSGVLDRYVGVSNTITHLRAAAGKSSDVLVPMPAEFRWMNSGFPSPWFPDNTVYRQSPDGSWQIACDALRENLKA